MIYQAKEELTKEHEYRKFIEVNWVVVTPIRFTKYLGLKSRLAVNCALVRNL